MPPLLCYLLVFKPEVVPYELRLLRGFKGCSHWAGNITWDEATQVMTTIDGMRIKTYDAVTATNLHTIRKAHEFPVTVGLWMGESQHIVTGCMDGLLKIWACQHTGFNRGKQGRRRCRRRRCRGGRDRSRRQSFRRKGHRQPPALVELFEGHSGAITGLVRHCVNASCIVTCGVDGTLRVWDVDRLAPVTNVPLPGAAVFLWALCGLGGPSRLVWAGAEGRIRTMIVSQVCQPLSFDTEEALTIRYSPPLGESTEEAKSISPIANRDGRFLHENRWVTFEHIGM